MGERLGRQKTAAVLLVALVPGWIPQRYCFGSENTWVQTDFLPCQADFAHPTDSSRAVDGC